MRTLVERCGDPQAKYVVWINNGSNVKEMCEAADALVSEGIIHEYGVVNDWASEALTFFEIDPETFDGGYLYSIAELVGLYRCKPPICSTSLETASPCPICQPNGRVV
jgi:hypothetical protein